MNWTADPCSASFLDHLRTELEVFDDVVVVVVVVVVVENMVMMMKMLPRSSVASNCMSELEHCLV